MPATTASPLSAPGPIEASILADLAPVFRVRAVSTPGGTLRVLEGGEGSPLVLIHGRGSAATTWFPLLGELARVHRVLAVDLPGFGSAQAFRFAGGGSEAALAFFVEPLEAWLVQEDLRSAAIAGHSLGGFVALELALRGRVSPSSLALIGSMGLGPEMTLASRVFFRAGPERIARTLGPSLFEKVVPPSDTPQGRRLFALSYELYTARGGRRDAAAAVDALAPLHGPAPNRRARLGEVKARALVLWGDHDEVVPAPVAITAAAAMPGAELRIEPLGHSLHTEQPERVLPILTAFFGC